MTWNDWLNLLLRWTHLVAGIYWIGSSFYFIWLDGQVEAAARAKPGAPGEVWMVHGGGFYRAEKHQGAPGAVPEHLHWFWVEATATWLSGMALLVVVYYLTGGVFLVDPAVARLAPAAAAGVGLGVVGAAWLAYDLLWLSPLARMRGLAPSLTLAVLVGAAYALCRLLSGRAAFIHAGAMLGTIMAANVWLRILPAQRRAVADLRACRVPDPGRGERARRRSLHNSYFTFPALFLMLSNHFPGVYASRLNWLMLALLAALGVAARHAMIGPRRARLPSVAAAAALAACLVFFTLPPPLSSLTAGKRLGGEGPAPSFAEVQALVTSRCVPCHSMHPRDLTFGPAPAGVNFEDPENIRRLAARIYVRAVVTRTMPLANRTGITDEERARLARWIEHGAPTN